MTNFEMAEFIAALNMDEHLKEFQRQLDISSYECLENLYFVEMRLQARLQELERCARVLTQHHPTTQDTFFGD